jgi:hypothetical protein
MTVRAPVMAADGHAAHPMPEAKPAQGEMQMGQATPQPSVPVMTVLSFLTLAAGLVLAWLFGAM